MTDEQAAGTQGNPDVPSAPKPAADGAVDRPVHDPCDGSAAPPGVPAAAPDPDPGLSGPNAADLDTQNSDNRVGRRDGGVTTRLSRRCLIAAAILLGVATLCLLPVALRDWGAQSAVLTLLALVAMVGAVIMWRRWALWSSVAGATVPPGLGFAAIAGDPRGLSPRPAGWPIKRRFGALVLPLRAESGPTPGDGALIVHARADGAAPAAGDRLRVVPIARRGDPVAAETDSRAAVHVLLMRDCDGTLFVATTRVTDTW